MLGLRVWQGRGSDLGFQLLGLRIRTFDPNFKNPELGAKPAIFGQNQGFAVQMKGRESKTFSPPLGKYLLRASNSFLSDHLASSDESLSAHLSTFGTRDPQLSPKVANSRYT